MEEVSVFDPWSEVVEDVIDGLKPVVQEMRTIDGTPIPKVAFDLDDFGEFVGELACPTRCHRWLFSQANNLSIANVGSRMAGWFWRKGWLFVREGRGLRTN